MGTSSEEKYQSPAPSEPETKPKKKICCSCPETKVRLIQCYVSRIWLETIPYMMSTTARIELQGPRDECIALHGECLIPSPSFSGSATQQFGAPLRNLREFLMPAALDCFHRIARAVIPLSAFALQAQKTSAASP